jgi:hypothetical protein
MKSHTKSIYVGFRAYPETNDEIRAEAERRGLSIKPRLIETWVDLVLFADSDSTEEVELSPCLQELVDQVSKHAEEKRQRTGYQT